MIECENCKSSCEDSSLYCTHCGKRLNTDSCRNCGNYVPPKAEYCPRCGYPTKGTVCARCGKVSPDTAAFCADCGYKLKSGGEQLKKVAVNKNTYSASAAPVMSEHAAKAVARNKANTAQSDVSVYQGHAGKGYYAYTIVRAFMLPLLLMCMFISSFFGTFHMKVVEPSINEYNVSVEQTDMIVTGFDAVRGMFLLINPPTDEESYNNFKEFVLKHKYEDADKAVRDFGALKLLITEENVTVDMIVQVVLWGLQSLALMVLTLVFFILTLIHAVKFTLKERDVFYKHESLPLALITALTFIFLITGGALAGAAISTVVLGLMGIAGITALRYAVEKHAHQGVMPIVRKGVVAVIAILVICFIGNNLLKIDYDLTYTYNDSEVTVTASGDYIDARDIYEGFVDNANKIEDELRDFGLGSQMPSEDLSGEFLNTVTALIVSRDEFDSLFKNCMVKEMGTPAIMSFIVEASTGISVSQMILSWLMFAFMMMAAGFAAKLIYSMLQAEANPDKNIKTLKWLIMLAVSTAGVLGLTAWQIVMSSSISNGLDFGFGYHIGAMPIATVVLALAGVTVSAVMSKIEKNKSAAMPEIAVGNATEQSASENAIEQNSADNSAEPQEAI